MKNAIGWLVLITLFSVAFLVGLGSRKLEAPAVTAFPTALATTEYHGRKGDNEPFLYAVPLGYFTPYNDVSIFEWPGASAPVVGSLEFGERTGYTSEYRTAEGETWLCVTWNVDEEIAGWECTGWAPASMGKVEREYEYPPDHDKVEEQEA
jgi:hypothetical protein